MYTYIYTHMRSIYIRIDIYTYICIDTYIYIYILIYIYKYRYIYTYMYIYIYPDIYYKHVRMYLGYSLKLGTTSLVSMLRC